LKTVDKTVSFLPNGKVHSIVGSEASMARTKSPAKSASVDGERIGARNEAKILKAASIEFARKGLDGARIAEIAERAGLPHPNVYYYFRTKESIYRRLIGMLIEDWDRALENISPERDPMDAIAAYVRAKFEHARKHSTETRLFASEVMTGARFLTPSMRRHMRATTVRYAKVIDGWIAENKIKPIDSRHFLIMIWATSEFYSFLEPLVCDALEVKKLRPRDYKSGADSLIEILKRALGYDTRP
jgi:TetR/AcrR family transcriptional regulator